jgi:hypothetical protein
MASGAGNHSGPEERDPTGVGQARVGTSRPLQAALICRYRRRCRLGRENGAAARPAMPGWFDPDARFAELRVPYRELVA